MLGFSATELDEGIGVLLELEGLELDEEGDGGATELLLGGGGGGTELLLGGGGGGGGGSVLQFDTICAAPALTSSIQAESDICEQAPAVNLQKTIWLPPEESLEGSLGGGEGSSLEQAKKVNAMAKITANERKRLVSITNSQFGKAKNFHIKISNFYIRHTHKYSNFTEKREGGIRKNDFFLVFIENLVKFS